MGGRVRWVGGFSTSVPGRSARAPQCRCARPRLAFGGDFSGDGNVSVDSIAVSQLLCPYVDEDDTTLPTTRRHTLFSRLPSQ